MSTPQTFTHIGTRPVRHDGLDKVTGRAAYGADLTMPGTLFGAIVRSPHAHARIVSIDTTQASKMPGVRAVITGRDIPPNNAKVAIGAEGSFDLHDMGENLLAHDKALYHGQAVAAVAATTLEQAEAAAAAVQVRYDVLQPVVTIEQAIAPNAPILHPGMVTGGKPTPAMTGPSNIAARMELRRGDVDGALAEADVVVSREFRTAMVHQGYIEPHACIARSSEDGQVTVWTSTQAPFLVRDACAGILGLSASKIKVIPSEIGGGFGGKITFYLEPIAVALSAKAHHRPVKIVMSRDEVFRATGPTSGAIVRMKMGAKKDGTIVAASASLWYEAGAFRGSPFGSGAMCALACYTIPNFLVEAHDVVLNRPKVAAYRAPGSPISALATESLVDELAAKLGIDPLELRLKNAVKEGDQAPYGPKFGPIGFRAVLEAVKNSPHWRAPKKPGQGRGLACGFWFNAGLNSSATVTLHTDGTAAVLAGNPDIGGTRVAQAMMVAEELGIPVDRVRPIVGDTDIAGYTDVTGGSRVCYATGTAVVFASRDVRDQLRQRAATTWGVSLDEVGWKDGKAVPLTRTDELKPLSVAELAASASKTGGPLIGRGSTHAATAGPAFAAHICDVEVDAETGCSKVVRYTAVQDVGKAVHPSYVEGQMQGGAAQGIGWALNEEYVFSADGVMQNAGFLDYRMPVASDLPMIDAVLVEVPNPQHPYGVRGVGEVPIVPPLAAVANAMCDATGVRFTELPMSPPRVLAGLAHRG